MTSFLFPALIFALIFAGLPLLVGDTHSNMFAPEMIQGDVIPISSGVPQTGSIPPADAPGACRIGNTQYAIQFPGGAMKLKVELSAGVDVDLYVRRDQPVVRQDGMIIADFRAVTAGPNKSLNLPSIGIDPLEEGTYFIAVSNCNLSGQADFTLTATILTAPTDDTVPLAFNVAEVGSIPAPTSGDCLIGQTQYSFPVPASVPCVSAPNLFQVEVRGDQNVDLYVRFNQRVAVEDGRVIADFASRSGSGTERLFFGSPAEGGTCFIAVNNCSTEKAVFTVGLILTIANLTPPPPPPTCEIERTPSGSFLLIIRGKCIRRGASIFVGGKIPKSVKFKQPDPTGTFFAKVIAKGKVCSGLPGAIIIRNPGEQASIAFQCNETCSN